MAHGDFKIGEICQRSGRYICATCRKVKRDSFVDMVEGGTFPFCTTCRERGVDEVDTLFKLSEEPLKSRVTGR